jgi:hypothetical protein
MSERIRWKPTEYGGFAGYVGTLASWAFQVYPPSARDDRGWILQAQLPGFLGRYATDPDDPDALKAIAERWLAGFVSFLGAIFPEDEPGAMFGDVYDEAVFRTQFDYGAYVRYQNPDAGWPGDQDKARELLTLGGVYRIAWSDIGQSTTSIGLVGIDATFNSVLFEPVDDPEAATEAAGTE